MITEVKFYAEKVGKGRRVINGKIIKSGKRLFIHVPYNKYLIDEIKMMEGAKWHGFDDKPIKAWSVTDSMRNKFALSLLQGYNPYAQYDAPLMDITPKRALYDHQIEMLRHAVTRNYSILACDPGTGKSLVAIELMEWVKEHKSLTDEQAWYVGPVAGVKAVSLELEKWDSKINPKMFTYEGLVKQVKNWHGGAPAPKVFIIDESSKVKTPTSQRSKATLHVAHAVREEWGDDGYVILMSGTPAPKSPIDWWNQCEIACPGFLREGNINKLKANLSLIEQRESLAGGVYPHTVCWFDDDKRCAVCGEYFEHENHTEFGTHGYRASVNEVSRLYKRMQGLVLVKRKSECLDLPEKQYEIIRVKPTVEIIRTARLIKETARRAIEALTLIRELSDGFQYVATESGIEECPNCHGRGVAVVKMPLIEHEVTSEIKESDFIDQELTCDCCGGEGTVPLYRRDTKLIECPKDGAFLDELDAYEDIGRYVVWGGFTGTIDKLESLAHSAGWATLRVDGRGYIGKSAKNEPLDARELLKAMDWSHKLYRDYLNKYPRICFVGHPEAGGMALTLTASPVSLFYSNSFKGEARLQAEDRVHRAGMDGNRACIIKDLYHLPTDELVKQNIDKKRRLQDITMGEIIL